MLIKFVNAADRTVMKFIEYSPEVICAIENNSDAVLIGDTEYKFQKKVFDSDNSSFIFIMRKYDKTKIPDSVRNVQNFEKPYSDFKPTLGEIDGLEYSIYQKALELAKTVGKLTAIKFIKEETGWGLKESKEYADRNFNI